MVNPDRNLYEPPYDDALLYDSDLEPERPRSRPLVVLLGIVVLAAFAGVVWVAYNQGVKQGQKGVPVLTAEAGPTRIVPESDGSSPVMNPAPDKAYDRLLNDKPEGEQVTIMPKAEQPRTAPAPQELASADPNNPTTGAAGGKYGNKATDFTPPPQSTEDVVPGMDSTVADLTPGKTPISATPREVPAKPAPQGSEDITQSLPSVQSATPRAISAPPAPAPVQTPKPQVAPSKPTPAAEIAPPKPAPAPVQPKPAPLAAPETVPQAVTESAPKSGGVMIQLGSFPNSELAASSWSKIKSANQTLLANSSPNIKSAEIPGKGTWYRLRVGGFADKAEAQSVCAQLQASGQACIIAAK